MFNMDLIIKLIVVAIFSILLTYNHLLVSKLETCKEQATARAIRIEDFNAIQAKLIKDVKDEVLDFNSSLDSNITIRL